MTRSSYDLVSGQIQFDGIPNRNFVTVAIPYEVSARAPERASERASAQSEEALFKLSPTTSKCVHPFSPEVSFFLSLGESDRDTIEATKDLCT